MHRHDVAFSKEVRLGDRHRRDARIDSASRKIHTPRFVTGSAPERTNEESVHPQLAPIVAAEEDGEISDRGCKAEVPSIVTVGHPVQAWDIG